MRQGHLAPATQGPNLLPDDYLLFIEFIEGTLFNKMTQALVHNLHLYILLCV